MENGYYFAYEGADCVLYCDKDGPRPREVYRDKDALWVWLMIMADQGKEIHKIQEFSFQRGFREATENVWANLSLTKEQEETLEEIDREGTADIKVYDQDYSDWT
jgi:hypothetical protein